jgi:hypothetical protein
MSAPFRIERPAVRDAERSTNEAFKDYLDRLLKMIPGEVVGLYMIGAGFIPKENPNWLILWSAFCLILVFVVRIFGTADPKEDKKPQPVPVVVAAGAFVVWLYWLGGPFLSLGFHKPFIASLLVLLWSFVIPFFYKGPEEA